MPNFSKWSVVSGFPTKTLYLVLVCNMLATRRTHLILLHVTTLIFGKEHKA
jgi:hypothetical protein